MGQSRTNQQRSKRKGKPGQVRALCLDMDILSEAHWNQHVIVLPAKIDHSDVVRTQLWARRGKQCWSLEESRAASLGPLPPMRGHAEHALPPEMKTPSDMFMMFLLRAAH